MTVATIDPAAGHDTAPVPAPAAADSGCKRHRYPSGWAAANEQRIKAATVTSAENVSRALEVLDGNIAPHVLEAARLRIDQPGLALSALARMAGCTKDVLAGRLRRLVKAAERAEQEAPPPAIQWTGPEALAAAS